MTEKAFAVVRRFCKTSKLAVPARSQAKNQVKRLIAIDIDFGVVTIDLDADTDSAHVQ